MNNKCRNLGLILLILGILGSCIMAFHIGREAAGFRDGLVTILVLIGGAFLSYTAYVGFNAFGEILENQEIIFEAISNLTDKENKGNENVPDGCWKCSCGKINPAYTGTCGCGKLKPK